MPMKKVCKLCGTEFETTSGKKIYCNRNIECKCKACGKIFIGKCNIKCNDVCSRTCASKLSTGRSKVCPICGDTFIQNSARQKYCKHLKHAICPICGKSYEYECCPRHDTTCGSKECRITYAHEHIKQFYLNTTKICEWCGKEFHPTTNTSKYCSGPHYRKCDNCGKEYEVDLTIQDYPRTCSKECAIAYRFRDGNPFQSDEFKRKAKETCLKRYGVDHPMKADCVKQKVFDTYKERTGYGHPIQNPEVRSRVAKSVKISGLELRVSQLFDRYGIQYEWHKMIKSEDGLQHEFDFFINNYNILVDCDGLYYHSYLSDPDGHCVGDSYDEIRLAVIPKDYIFVLIVEGDEERGIKRLVDMISGIDSGVFDYEGDLFKWCRSIDFPYPSYDADRMKKDFDRLCKYQTEVYKPNARLCESAISNFHKSIFDAHVDKYVSPKQAWYDDELLKKVIKNRLIYQNDIDPYKILRGFNISKICPKVSIFNPVLARYIVTKYLSEFDTVFDPFSGFSGRLLGTVSTGKRYLGQDLNAVAVKESNEIVDFYGFTKNQCVVRQQDIFDSSGTADCLFTCPPYGTKEVYSTEVIFKSCDDWIDEILQRFSCKRYVFVVDSTVKYSDMVVEGLQTVSHYAKIKEYVIVIDK